MFSPSSYGYGVRVRISAGASGERGSKTSDSFSRPQVLERSITTSVTSFAPSCPVSLFIIVTLHIAMADAQINHQDARNYWQSIDADVNGMLGGFPYVSKVDLQGSKNFLAKLGIIGGGKSKKKVGRAVDCGAG